jgi:CBS domain-containing protein
VKEEEQMRVRELLGRKPEPVVTIGIDEELGAAVRLLMRERIGGLPVVDPGGAVVGFVAERDVVAALDEHGPRVAHLPLRRVMRRPAPVCGVDDTLHGAMERMSRERLRHVVVLDGDRIAGLVSVGDLVKHRLNELELEAGVLRDYVAAQRALRV